MKLSDFLAGVGRPVAFYPGLVKALDDRNEAIFICQMAYWRGKGDSKDGWIYKTSDEIEQETSLTYKEQTNVRKGLVDKGLLKEKYARTEHKMYFRVDWDAVNGIWEQFTDGHMPPGQVPPSRRSDGSLPEVSSLNSNTETTTENTHKAGGLSEKEKAQANAQVTAMIENTKKVRYENRDKIPEPLLAFSDVYVELTGQKPTKRVLMDWLSTFSDWIGEGLQPKDIRAAYQHATRPDGGFLVGRPGSLTNTAVALKSKSQVSAPQIDKQAVEDTQKLLEAKFDDKVYAPPPAWVAEKVKEIAARKTPYRKGLRR
jgi:hypothetical protein